MALTNQEKVRLEMLLKLGDEQKAMQFLQEELNLSAEEARQAVEKLKPSVKPLPRSLIQKFNSRKNETKNDKMGSRIGLLFMVIGIIMLGFSGYTAYSNYKFMENAISITGKVIDLDTHYSSDDDGGSTLMYSPVFEYEYNGQTYKHYSDVSSSSPDFEINEEAEIFINPDSPGSALVNSFMERWFVVVLLGGMGIMFAGFGYMAVRLF
jgi:hypothetical protein